MNGAESSVRWVAVGVAAFISSFVALDGVASGVAYAAAPPAAAPPNAPSGPAPHSNEPGDPIVVARARVLYGFRSFHYSDALYEFYPTFPALQSYDLDHGVGAGIELGVYPFASRGSRTIQIGVEGSFRKEALLADSKIASGPVDASSSEWLAALRLQIPIGPHEFGLFAGAGSHSFSLTDASRNPKPVPIPDVAWTFFRAGVDVRLNVHPMFLGFAFGYRAPFAAGTIGSYDWFPRLTVSGMDGSIFAGASLSENVELSVGYELRRYAFAAHSKLGDTAVAGGAVDLYGSGSLALGLRF